MIDRILTSIGNDGGSIGNGRGKSGSSPQQFITDPSNAVVLSWFSVTCFCVSVLFHLNMIILL